MSTRLKSSRSLPNIQSYLSPSPTPSPPPGRNRLVIPASDGPPSASLSGSQPRRAEFVVFDHDSVGAVRGGTTMRQASYDTVDSHQDDQRDDEDCDDVFYEEERFLFEGDSHAQGGFDDEGRDRDDLFMPESSPREKYTSASPLSSSPPSPRSHDSPDFDDPEPSTSFARSPSPPSPIERWKRNTTWEGARGLQQLPFSLWDYLQQEVLAVEMDGEEGAKSERVTNFLTVPGEVEKIIGFGFIICLDSFLYNFTILPLRVVTACFHLGSNLAFNLRHRSTQDRRHLRLSHKCDLVKAVITVGTLFILHRITDASQMYHSVRGQETLKLYVIFNVLEIADRLCCSFGQDLQDSLFSRQTLGRRIDGSHPRIRPVALVALNLAYVVAHTLVLFYQLVTLNVAINSYSNALLTLLLSNQFVEIKGAVFKKFEKEQLFQVTCADIVERFQLAIMLFIIALRNLIELSSASSSSLFSFLPASFSLTLVVPSLPTLSLIQTIFSPAVIVLLSECAVDWLKHAFITKFNHIRPAVYGRFIDVLCKDLIGGGSNRRKDQPFVDQSPLVSRRLGFAALPLGCLVVRVIFQAFEMLTDDSHIDECAPPLSSLTRKGAAAKFTKGGFGSSMRGMTEGVEWSGIAVIGLGICVLWVGLIALKLLIGINLRAFASSRYATMESRLQEDQLNDRSRPHIGTTPLEKELDREASHLLQDKEFNVPGRVKISLETLGRYDMVKSRVF